MCFLFGQEITEPKSVSYSEIFNLENFEVRSYVVNHIVCRYVDISVSLLNSAAAALHVINKHCTV